MQGVSIKRAGFTIVELLIVIVVIAILAMITVVGYNGIQERARLAKAKADIKNIEKAILVGRTFAGGTLYDITGRGWTSRYCVQKPAGTDLAALPDSDRCISDYKDALEAISEAGGVSFGDMRDPWGRPYLIDENEGDPGSEPCTQDTVAMYSYPFNGNIEHGESNHPETPIENVPLGGATGC